MTLRPVTRRGDPNDLETARQVVSRAERRALEKAENLRLQAEDLLKAWSRQTVDAEQSGRDRYAGELQALRDELDAMSRRASTAERELEALRFAHAELQDRLAAAADSSGKGTVAAERSGTPTAADALGAPTAADALGAPAAADALGAPTAAGGGPAHASGLGTGAGEPDAVAVASDRAEVVELLAAAAREAEELLAQAGRLVDEAKDEAGRLVDEARATAAGIVAQAEAEGARIVESARVEAAASAGQIVEEARVEAAASAGQIVEEARVEAAASAGQIVEEARAEADRVRREAEEASRATRRRLVEEIASLRGAMERAGVSFDRFIESVGATGTGSGRA